MSGEQKSEVRPWNGKITVPHPASRFKSVHTRSTHWLKRSQIPLRKIFAMATQQFLREILIFFQVAIIICQHNDSGNRATSRFWELGIFQKKVWDNTDNRGPKIPYGLLDKMGADRVQAIHGTLAQVSFFMNSMVHVSTQGYFCCHLVYILWLWNLFPNLWNKSHHCRKGLVDAYNLFPLSQQKEKIRSNNTSPEELNSLGPPWKI